MHVNLKPEQLSLLLRDAAELGALQTLIHLGKIKPYLNQSQAFKLYGRANVKSWIFLKLLVAQKDGNFSACLRIDRLQAHVLFLSMKHDLSPQKLTYG